MKKIKEVLEWGLAWGLLCCILLPIIIGIVFLTNSFATHLFVKLIEPVEKLYINTVHSATYKENQLQNEMYMTPQNEKLNRLLKLSNVSAQQEDVYKVLEVTSNLLPESVLHLLERHHVLIEFVDYDLQLLSEEFENASGFYEWKFKKIYIEAKDLRGGYETTIAVFLHEIGHAVDQLFSNIYDEQMEGVNDDLAFISSQTYFNDLFLLTRDETMSSSVYGYDDRVEYFAQMFYLYYYAPNLLANRSITMFNFMDQLYEKINLWFEFEKKKW